VHRFVLLIAVIACTAPPARENVVLRIAVWGPLGELAPSGSESALASVALPWVFERLATVDADGQLTPVLARRVVRSSPTEIEVELRTDASFSDGSPVTVADVVRSLEIGGLTATESAGTLAIRSRQVGVPADALLLQTQIFRESQGKFFGSGPFAVVARTEDELRLARRMPRSGHVNEVRVTAYPTPRDAFAHTLKGDANLIVDVESKWLEFFRGVPSLQTIRAAGRSADAIIFNPQLPRSGRRELAAALESARLRDLAYAPSECAETGSGANGYSTILQGPPLRILSWGPFERLALAVRRTIGDRGGEIIHASPQEALSRVRTGDFDLVAARPISWPSSALALVWRTGAPNNFVGYSNRNVDDAIDAGDWVRAEAALREDPPAAFICTHNHVAVVDARIKNPVLGPYDVLETLPEWEVAQ
jgi:hypothetical protein